MLIYELSAILHPILPLPIGCGDLNFAHIFADILPNFMGTIIIELLNDEEVIAAKHHIETVIGMC